MRRALLLAAFVACSAEKVEAPNNPYVSWNTLKPRVVDAGGEVVSAHEQALPGLYVKALASKDFSELPSLLDDDAHFASPGFEDSDGRARVTASHAAIFGAFEGREVTLSRVFRTPTTQIVEWTFSGSHEHEFHGVAPTHKHVLFRGVSLLWTKDDGSIDDVHVYVDVALVLSMLDAGPKELRNAPTPGPLAPATFQSSGASEEAENQTTVTHALDALEGEDEAKYLSFFSPDYELTLLETPKAAPGVEQARTYFRRMHAAIGQLDTTVMHAWGTGPFVVVEYVLGGEQVGPIGWVPFKRPRVVRMQVVNIAEVQGGKIKAAWRYDNPMQLIMSSDAGSTADAGPPLKDAGSPLKDAGFKDASRDAPKDAPKDASRD